jgi:ankyrin repeat protein
VGDRWILKHGLSGDTPLHLFSLRGDLEAVQVLLSAGADISAIGEREDTALFSAIMGENIDVVKYLVEHGCPLDHRNEDGKTALDFAKSLNLANALGNPEVIPLLENYLK